jgi:cell division septation protein DedD
MEDTTTSWKNHSFTLLVFGGIVVLCSIFFVLGMLVGRNQGKGIAERAFAEEAKNKPVAVAGADDIQLNYYPESSDKDLKLVPAEEPRPEDLAVPQAAAINGGSSSTARRDVPAEKATAKPSPTPKTISKPPVEKTPAPTSKDRYVQLMSTKNQKQAKSELKKVQSKGFKGVIMEVTLQNERWHRVVVGPYKESEINLTLSDLKAKGYKDPRLMK